MAQPPRRITAAEMRRILDPDDPRATRRMAFASVTLNLEPLARAIADLGREVFKGYEISAALNKGIQQFNTQSYRRLKVDTKIAKNVTRLRRGVRVRKATRSHLEARYTIRDRNLRITKAYFDAAYRPGRYGRPGGLARAGRGTSVAGANWTSWDGHRLGRHTFMLSAKRPVFIRLRPSKRRPIQVVRGPNPAEMMQIHAPQYAQILRAAADAELMRQIRVAYQRAERTVKARYGL